MRLAFIILIWGLVWIAPACNRPSPSPTQTKPTILVSIAPYQFLVQQIGGDALSVQTVVPPGISPHAYEPTAQQVRALDRGAVWFRIGELFEDKILSILKSRNPNLVTADLREGIDLLDDPTCHLHSSQDHRDRHIWLSPKLAAIQTGRMAEILAQEFPEHRETFFENAKTLQEALSQLDQEIATLLHSVKDRVLLVSHPAFGYFCRDYQFEQLSVEFEGKDPRPRHLEEILQKAISHRAEIAIALPQHNNKGAQIIAEKLHVPVRMIDPYSPQYFETLLFLAHMIADPQYQQ